MDAAFPSLVSTQWLSHELDSDDLIILDASRHLPAAGRDPKAEFAAEHIPGALFLDLATLTNADSPVPAALPSPAQLAQRLAYLGVRDGNRIVLYDDSAVKSSARAWFTLTAHGLDRVAILDGGLAKWRAEGRPIETGSAVGETGDPAELSETRRVVSKAQVLDAIADASFQIVDARSADRVFGSGIDPVHGGQNGRIPGSFNVPFDSVYAEDGAFHPPSHLRRLFEQAGVDLDRPITTSCGSGLTASVLLFALHLIGNETAQLYDGSWQEWEADPGTPKEQGPV